MGLRERTEAFFGVCGTQRPIRLRLGQESPTLDGALLVKRVTGTESLCGVLEYRLLCVSTDARLALKQFIALPAELQFVTDRGELHAVCGIVADVAAGQADGGLATYQLVLRDALSLLADRSNTRVFRNLDEVEITARILDEWRRKAPLLARAFAVDWTGVSRKYPAREFTMQHNESDADFLRRLWKRRGIAWFIRPGQPAGADTPVHALVLFDRPQALARNSAGTVRFHRDDATEATDTITAWGAVRTLKPGHATRHSWDYLRAWPMETSAPSRMHQGAEGNAFAATLDDYLLDVPHAGVDNDDYRALGDLRMERHEYEAKSFHGEGGVRTLRVGEWFTLSGHGEIDTHAAEERHFVVTHLEVEAENNLRKTVDDQVKRLFAANRWEEGPSGSVLQGAGAERGVRYANRFRCVRRGIPIVPAFDPRTDLPRPRLQSAIVVGPKGEEVHCDEFGRVKVRFPGARAEDHEHAQGAGASGSDRDSAWVRVASNWAGIQRGMITLPRVGDEVMIDFLGGDPDKPIIVAQVHGGRSRPHAFSGVGGLPGNRYQSGIKSREVGGSRYNQLRLDDTPGQISAQLASEHGHSALNLGWLSHPRRDGKGEARGEGAELRSDHAVAVRGAQGVLISAAASPGAGGAQLDRDELLTLVDALHGVQRQLADLAATHHGDDADSRELRQLLACLTHWEAGSNTAGEAAGDGSQPVVALSAPAGATMTSQQNIAIGAQTHVDVVSIGNTQLSVGKKLLAQASESISLFAHRLGIKLIAASGKAEIQTHGGDIELTSAQRILLSASDEIVLQAPRIRFVAQGAQVDIGGGAIAQQSSGDHTIKSAKFSHLRPGNGSPADVTPPASAAAHDQQAVLRWLGTDEPMPNQRYRITTEDGRVFEGRTDAGGATERFGSEIPFGRYTVEALDD